MDDAHKERNFQIVNAILRILAIAYFLLQFLFLRFLDYNCYLTTIPILIIAVTKRKDTANLLLSIIASAGILFNFIASNYLPRSFMYEKNLDLTFFGQMIIVIWALSLFTGTYLLALRDLVIASKENGENGRTVRIIGYILLLLSSLPAISILGFIIWMAVTNYYP